MKNQTKIVIEISKALACLALAQKYYMLTWIVIHVTDLSLKKGNQNVSQKQYIKMSLKYSA